MLENPGGKNQLTSAIIGAAIRVHQELGPGLLESAYEECLRLELLERGRTIKSRVKVPLRYRGQQIGTSYELDLLVDEAVIVEVKSVDSFAPVHVAQLLTYLKLANVSVGLLINFNVPVLAQGVKRLVNGALLRMPQRVDRVPTERTEGTVLQTEERKNGGRTEQ